VRHELRSGAVAVALAAATLASSAPAPRASAICPLAVPEIEVGDVVFIGVDRAIWARIASASSDPTRRFGHVGIAVRGEGDGLAIVHASGSPIAENARVVAVSPETFVAEADRIGVYRLREVGAAQRFASAALARVGQPFDTEFSLASEQALYCTELVWRALSAMLGRDSIPAKPIVAGRAMITLGALEQNELLNEAAFTVRPAGCG
jgi:hypothetical protein